MSSSTTQKQPAAIIIEEGSLSLGKRKRQTTSKDDKEILRDLVKEVLQQKLSNIISDKIKKYNEEEMVVFLETKKTCPQGSLEMVSNLAKTNHNIHRTAKQISKALARLGGTKQLWEQVKKDHSKRLYKEHKDKDRLRMTSPVAIVSILRDDIPNDLVYNSLKQAAMDATTAVSNVSALVRMTLLSLAHHNISIIERDDVQLKKEKSGFDITKILPKSFAIRDREPLNNSNKIMVAHPNLSLKDQLNKLYKPNTRAKDLQEICTNVHLQYIQSHHLGNKKDNSNDTIHPLWSDLIFKKSNLPSTADGSSITTAAAIKEFNTNLQNMWSRTNIYAKSQRYLIRILLRVHLAPEREQKTTSKIQHECHQMAKHIRHGKLYKDDEHKYATRVQSCMKRLDKLASILKDLEAGKSAIDAKTEKDKNIDCVASNLGPGDLVEMWEDEIEEEEEEVVEEVEEGQNLMKKVKEASATRIRKLEGLIKALLRDPKINRTGNVSDNEVLKAFHDKSLKSDEVAVVKLITNQLLPYSPHSDSICLLTQLPFVLLANSILIAVGYHDHVQEISPIVSPHKIHAILINSAIMYETLTPHKDGIPQGPFEVTPVGTDDAITSSYAARKNGDPMWGSFFDKEKVVSLCNRHKLIFANRMVVRPDRTVSILGLIKDGYIPVVSEYETRQKKNRKKKKKKKNKGIHVAKEYVGKSLQQLQQQLDHIEDMINKMTAALDILKTQSREATEEWNRTKTERLKSRGTIKRLLSQKLKGQVYAKRKKSHLLKLARRYIKDWRSSKYYLNKAIENHGTTGDLPIDVPSTKPTPERMQHEDVTANIDVSGLNLKKVAYGATDYGHVVLAQTIPLTNDDVQFHVHLYNQQQEHQQQQFEQIEGLVNYEKAEIIDASEEKQEVDFISSQLQQQESDNNNNNIQKQLQEHQLKETDQTLQQRQQSDRHCFWAIRTCADHDSIRLTDQPLSNQQIEQLRNKLTNEIKFTKKEYYIDDLKLSKPFSITHEQVDEESFNRKFNRRRSKKNKKVVAAEELLNKNSFNGIMGPSEILKRQKNRLSVKNTLRDFYYSPSAMNERRHQTIRNNLVYSKLARAERHYVKKVAADKLHLKKKEVTVMMLIGLAGMGFNTFLKGRPRRGGKKFRGAHYHSTTVGLQNEHRSSQTCVFCFSPLKLLPSNIVKNGKKKKTSHGALVCTNPDCLAVKAGYTTFNRDSVGATGIGLAATTTSKFQLDEKFSLISPSLRSHGASQTSTVIHGPFKSNYIFPFPQFIPQESYKRQNYVNQRF
ncbi:hypothetical protein INT45_013529 [Circinella minor]|uniref:Uncharacterized protein n=1 Tax=Circinella minor TaxID=1195481 RepID=A0A8H7S7I9_9FUNG|nr:hypothetical protein INT45_013529 [Circinella minor]